MTAHKSSWPRCTCGSQAVSAHDVACEMNERPPFPCAYCADHPDLIALRASHAALVEALGTIESNAARYFRDTGNLGYRAIEMAARAALEAAEKIK